MSYPNYNKIKKNEMRDGMNMEEVWEKAMRQAKANLAHDGFVITAQHDKLVKAVLEGKITEKEFQQKALELAQKRKP